MKTIVYLSLEGQQRYQAQLKKFNEELAEIRAEKSIAYTATGDTWHDNPHWSSMEQQEIRKVTEIMELEAMIANSRSFTPPDIRRTEKVELGSIIHIERCDAKTGKAEEMVWEIVPYGDTDLDNHKIAYNAPLARSLMNHEPGDEVVFRSTQGASTILIMNLYPTWEQARIAAKNIFPQRPADEVPQAPDQKFKND